MMQKIAIGSDHAGFELKEQMKAWLQQNSYTTRDFGAFSSESSDYPDYSHPLASAVEKGEYDLGILICGSGNGVAITANKHQGVRAAICWKEELAATAREHNNANVLCLPSRQISVELAFKITDRFLHSSFEGGRHARRVDKIPC
jgi:ribose 5-phosphate isomerase B